MHYDISLYFLSSIEYIHFYIHSHFVYNSTFIIVLIFNHSGITNPKLPGNAKDAIKSFNFDYSYWSHDVSFSLHDYIIFR